MRHKLFFSGKTIFSLIVPAVALASGLLISGVAHAETLMGAGSTFINPIMTKWIASYKESTGVDVNYQPIGSGGGINALIAHTVDFAGSDVPMNGNEKAQAGASTVTIPDVIGAIVISYNIPGVGPGIALSGPVVADIFEGKITYWDDPRITKLSPGVKFPHENILVVHRSDGSGTTAIFTDYLSKVSGSWKNNIGTGKSVNWPVGLGGKGNPGVAGYLANKPYSIGYLELAYAIQKHISYASMENRSHKLVYPNNESIVAAGEGMKIPENLEISIANSSNPKAYPIVGVSYLIIYTSSPKNAAVKQFFEWVLTKGQAEEYTGPGSYSPLSHTLKEKCLQALSRAH